ncbi:NmrA-like family domain-containing protein 1 [Colletotrichum spaethianum]|uniref:NmrA-like family domain-containing protein 1 n=1 Tax=Colletotrichum spaethianum TaxID=700344 RepID=A0AA37L424_9PEZI|nr:NmrA-like family domain-containing protein 1 [Colletotrichum spaethianum]GKT41492.1 NmrA-like family domain-containing protein 1 [Colletotrichum spaethianum]
MSSKLIVICGVTGNQGRSVAQEFLKEAGWKVRGITRDATKPDSVALASQGVEIVEGNLDNFETLKAAFQGANAIFGNTIFPFALGASSPQLRPNQSLPEWCYELEVQQGKNLVDAAAEVDSLEIFVWSTLSAAKKWSAGKYKNIYHFDSKAAVVEHIESAHPDLFKKTSFLELGLFMTNWKMGEREDGTMVLRMPGSGGTQPIPHVLVEETGLYVKALVQAPPGTHLLACSELMTWPDYVKLWSRIQGIPAVFERFTLDDMDKLAPGGFGIEIGEMHAYNMEFGYWGGDPSIVLPADLGLKGQTTSVEDYIKREDWSELLART